MSLADDLWALIPEFHRRRDAASGHVLRALVEVLGKQSDVIHNDISGLYDNWFIETCDDWVVPYLADLTGALPLAPTAATGDVARLAAVAPARRLVADAIRFRRRKGCFSIVAPLARAVTGWPAEAVEFGRHVAATADLRAGRVQGGTASLRDASALAATGAPDDPVPRGVDVREAAALRSPGLHAPDNLGIFLFTPLLAAVNDGTAFCVDEEGSTCFQFDPLGADTPLYHRGQGPDALPGPVTRARLGRRRRDGTWHIDPSLYGPEGAIRISIQTAEGRPYEPVLPDQIVPADLAAWRDRPPQGQVALDPERGRIAFFPRGAPHRVRVSHFQALPGPIGGATAPRPAAPDARDSVIVVSSAGREHHNSLRSALAEWRRRSAPAVIEFSDSGTYDEDNLLLDFSEDPRRLVIRAAPGTRPVIRLGNYEAGALDVWRVQGDSAPGGALVLEGLTIGGRGIALTAYAGSLEIRHCTLLPGWLPAGERVRRVAGAPSLAFTGCAGSVTISSSIIGPVFIHADENADEPLAIELRDTVLDGNEGNFAFLAHDAVPFATLTLRNVTVFGRLAVHAIALAENSIFAGEVRVARCSEGCLRFCFVPPASRTPHRFECVPRAAAPDLSPPVFVSRTCGTPGYAVLASACPGAIARGAEDRAEMGAHHDLFRPQRLANLRAALDEYLPASTSAGITCVS